MADTNATDIPIFGYPGPQFYIIHILAVASCSVSVLSSISILTFLFVTEKRTSKRRFYRWTKGERLVVYIAAFDLAFSVAHIIDHVYILVAIAHPVLYVCQLFAFFVIHGFTGQWLVIFYSAMSAFVTVIFEKQVNLGRYDWRLLVFANGIPGLLNAFGVVFNYIGPGGAWCVFARNRLGSIMTNVNAVIMLVVFFSCAICYIAIVIKIRASGTAILNEVDKERREKNNRSGRVMMVFVVAFMIQWWSWAVQAVWSYFGIPSIWIIITVVFFCNIGGLLNAFAYTIIRRNYLKSNRKRNQEEFTQSKSVESGITATTTPGCSSSSNSLQNTI